MHFEYLLKWLQPCFVVTWLVPCETAAVSVHVLCTPYNHKPAYNVTFFEGACVFNSSLRPALLAECLVFHVLLQ